MKVPIVFFGASKYVFPILDMLRSEYDVRLVVTTEMDPLDSVPSYCKEHSIPFRSIEKFTGDLIQEIKDIEAPVAVLAFFGIILPESVLNIFPKGIINIHPSLLPKYRGATPVQTTLLNGDTVTGVSVMKLDEKMDHGPLLAQEEAEVLPEDTTITLYDKLFTKGAQMLSHALPLYVNDNLPLTDQNHEKATFTKAKLTRLDGFIDINNSPDPKLLHRMIRAYYPWPGVWTKMMVNNKEKIVKLLPDNMIHVEGKKPMSLKDFSNGYPEAKTELEKILNLKS